MLRPTGVGDQPTKEVVQRFLASLRGLHVQPQVVKDEAELIEALRDVFSKTACKSVVVAGIPARYVGAVKVALAGVKTDFVEDLQGRPRDEAVGVLAAADVGVTWAVNGVAMEGAMLEVVYDDSFKLASALPIVHIALLESSSILRDLAEALPQVARLVREAPPNRKPIISFIAGPSKTGDIEMRLLYGVHGPHTVHAIVLDWR
jgi:L-lactate dehydrogenase complex protein LldG